MAAVLVHYPITHAGIFPFSHPQLHAQINGRSVIRYLRFLRTVTVDHLELTPVVNGRWVPNVPTHPAHLLISALNPSTLEWELIKEVNLPPDPRIGGKGLTQSTPEAQVNAHFDKILKDTKPHIIKLGGIKTHLLKVECDREHPVWPSHGEMYASIHSVPFGALDSLKAFGPEPKQPVSQAPHFPILTKGAIKPIAPKGMSYRQIGEMAYYESKYFSVGFSLRRPMLMQMGWDWLGKGMAPQNRVVLRRIHPHDVNRGACGPILICMDQDLGSHRWSGQVEIRGNKVIYKNLQTVPGISLDAVFTIDARGMDIQLTQQSKRDVPVLEAEAWRFAFAISYGMTGVAAIPTELPGRSGDVAFPAMFSGDGNGALSIRPLAENSPGHLQVESYRTSFGNTYEVTAGLSLCKRPEKSECMKIAKGTVQSAFRLEVSGFLPVTTNRKVRPSLGVQRHWTSNFSCFRSEWAGFSNNATSTNCHVNQHGPIEVSAFTAKPEHGPDPVELAKFTLGRALMDGSGYSYWRNLYKDSDPVLVMSTGRVYQVRHDLKWIRKIQPGLEAAAERILRDIDKKAGLVVCHDLTGNTNSFRWSCNSWDIVGFGHIDAYVNAFSYRAMKNAAAMFRDLHKTELSARCHDAAESIRHHYAKELWNPKTGVIACWRSRDGRLHDYISPWINGPACAFGVVEKPLAKKIMTKLEATRDSLGITSACYGVPFMFKPFDPGDHMMQHSWDFGKTEPTFEFYTDGSMGPLAALYYIRALSTCGLKNRAKKVAQELDQSLAEGLLTGRSAHLKEGREFLTWEGMPCGYEGTFGPTFGILYAIAIEQGLFTPPDPEWWPE